MKEQKNIKQAYIPTIEEMQSWYEDDLRREASKSSDYENNTTDGRESFFKAFRKLAERDGKIPPDSKKNNAYYEKYKAYVEEETANQGKKIQEIENLIEYEEFFLRWERSMSSESSNSGHYGSNPATRYRVDRIEKLEKELENIIENSPDAWEFYYQRQLISDIETQQQQRLITVPYVVKAKHKIIDSLNLGVPVYIVGHLGSGKTQLATEAALDFNIQNKIQSELEDKMEDWFSANPSGTEKDAIQKFKEFNEERKLHYKNILTNGSKEEIESLQPLFISGSHNLTYEDMFVEKTLSLEHSFSQRSYADYLNMIIGDFYEWMDEHKARLEQMTDEEQLQLKIQIWKSFSDLLVASNSSFGTTIKKIEREILIAVKEGRPVIVDELNTIAMQNLIALNDILQRHAGNTAYITGVGPVLIKHGFGFIGTGNLSTQMVNYEGTNELNPAFKSRFVTIEYNYVPQKITGSLEDQEFPEKNELFRIIITRLADKNGNIHIPDSKRTLEELFRFSQLCRVTQNIFMGKWKENEVQKDFGTDEPELRESVLSIRNILHVLDNFDQMPDVKGQVKVTRIHTEHDFYEFGRCLEISNGLFVVENGDEKLNLFEIIEEKNEYRLIFHKDIYCTIPNWTALEKINEDYFVAGTKMGELYFIKYENQQLTITEKINCGNDEIRQIRCLEDENGSKTSLIVAGNKGHLKIFSLCEDAKTIKKDGQIKGKLDVDSFINTYPDFIEAEKKGNHKNLPIFNRYLLEPQTDILPERIEISFVIDNSGSMDASKIEGARKALAVTLLSIDDFNRYLKSNAEQLNQKVEVLSET